MKQIRPVKAPPRARLNALTRQDLRTVVGGHNGTIVVEGLLGISGGGAGRGIGGSGAPHG